VFCSYIQLKKEKDMTKVLVVDDSNSIRDMVSFTLKSAGYETVEAKDGQDGLNKAKGAAIDLVISDVNMPIMDGITLCQELRKLPSFKFTPILMLTTESSGDMKMRGKAAGATGWLVKPFNPEKLLATIKRVVR
jgi:two-component system chemotaxis response regulator CheY